jgi:hypothetical protein
MFVYIFMYVFLYIPIHMCMYIQWLTPSAWTTLLGIIYTCIYVYGYVSKCMYTYINCIYIYIQWLTPSAWTTSPGLNI